MHGLRHRYAQSLRGDHGLEGTGGGNPGDVRPVGERVSELRIDYGPGYRVCFKRRPVVVLLAGGDKCTQGADIETALRLARNL